MKKQLYIGTSWKMNKVLSEALLFVDKLKTTETPQNIQRFIIPSFTNVREVSAALLETDVKVGVQNMHWEVDGAWTGEISPLMVKDAGATLVEIGHSERRKFFGETDEMISLKVKAAIDHGLIPLICIGETFEEREDGLATKVLENQVRSALSKLTKAQWSADILFAYEPVWAIGNGGEPASAKYANARHKEISLAIEEIIGRKAPCLYGGSVNQKNCRQLIEQPYIDGLFIGRAAWDVDGYLQILNHCKN